jgi:hypothetical protein
MTCLQTTMMKRMQKTTGPWRAKSCNLCSQTMSNNSLAKLKILRWAPRLLPNSAQHLLTLIKAVKIAIVMIQRAFPEVHSLIKTMMMMRMSHGMIDSAAKKTYRTKALRSPRIMKMRRTLRTQRWTTALKTLCKIHTTTSKVSSMKSRHNSSQQLRELIALIVEHLYSGRTDLVRLMLTKEA